MKIEIRKSNILRKPIRYLSFANTLIIDFPNVLNLPKLFKYGIKYPILYWFNRKSRSNICECGHMAYEHHGGVITNINYSYSPIQINGTIRQECEHNGFNGIEMPDEDGSVCKCSKYMDKNWIFKLNNNYKYKIDWKNLKYLIPKKIKKFNPYLEIAFVPLEWSFTPKYNNNSHVYDIDWLCFSFRYYNIE